MAFGNATKGYVKKHSGGGGGGGTSNYNDLSNKPSINGVTLSGNKTSGELNIGGITLTPINVENNQCQFTIDGVKAIIIEGSYLNTYNNITLKNTTILSPSDLDSSSYHEVIADNGKYLTIQSSINQNQVTLNREFDGGLTFSKVYLIK